MAWSATRAGSEWSYDPPSIINCQDDSVGRTPSGEEQIDGLYEGDGLRFQVDEVHRCIAEGLLESPRMPLDESIAIAETLDAIRAQIGVRYPGEDALKE